jgi:hypothetical protein
VSLVDAASNLFGNSLSNPKKSLAYLSTPPNFKVPYQLMFLFLFLTRPHHPLHDLTVLSKIGKYSFTPGCSKAESTNLNSKKISNIM